jgi:hypothetical protein
LFSNGRLPAGGVLVAVRGPGRPEDGDLQLGGGARGRGLNFTVSHPASYQPEEARSDAVFWAGRDETDTGDFLEHLVVSVRETPKGVWRDLKTGGAWDPDRLEPAWLTLEKDVPGVVGNRESSFDAAGRPRREYTSFEYHDDDPEGGGQCAANALARLVVVGDNIVEPGRGNLYFMGDREGAREDLRQNSDCRWFLTSLEFAGE